MTIFKFLQQITAFIDQFLVPLIFAIAFIVFIWGVFNYFIAGAGNDEKRETGKKFVGYGLAGFVIMIAIWGIVNLIINSLGFDTKSRPPLPVFDGKSQQQAGNAAGNPQNVFGNARGEVIVGVGSSCRDTGTGPLPVCNPNIPNIRCNTSTYVCEIAGN